MKATRENVGKALELLSRLQDLSSPKDYDEGDVASEFATPLSEFLQDCARWLPPERDYNRVMEHKSKFAQKPKQENSE